MKAYDDPTAKHANGTNEHTLCGMAFDAFSSGDIDYPLVYAICTNVVDCDQCMQVIEHVYSSFTRKGQVK